MKTPHLLLAASNAHRLRENLSGILDATGLALIDGEIANNCLGLFRLGESHYDFAQTISKQQWRQRVSRLYYGAYNVTRSLRFSFGGHYSRDSSDHQKVGTMPKDFPTAATYENKLNALREDRNLCDYDHTADESELVIPVKEADALVKDLLSDARKYLQARGVPV